MLAKNGVKCQLYYLLMHESSKVWDVLSLPLCLWASEVSWQNVWGMLVQRGSLMLHQAFEEGDTEHPSLHAACPGRSVIYVKNKLSWPGVEDCQDYTGDLDSQRVVASGIWGIYQSTKLLLGVLRWEKTPNTKRIYWLMTMCPSETVPATGLLWEKSVSFKSVLQLSPYSNKALHKLGSKFPSQISPTCE